MADTTALKNRIRAAINANDNQEITGPVLQQALLDMVDELNGATETEAQQRQSSDSTLQQGINNEVQRAQQAESVIGGRAQSALHRTENLELNDVTGTVAQTDEIAVALRTNIGSEQDPEYETLSTLHIPSATPAKAGLMSANQANAFDDLCPIKHLGVVSSIENLDNLPKGIISFKSESVPTGLPNLSYGGGALLVTSRKSKNSLYNHDLQYIISGSYLCVRTYWQGAWTDWTTTNIAALQQSVEKLFVQKGADISSLDINSLPNGIISFTSASVPSNAPSIPYGDGCILVTIRNNDETLTYYDRQYIITTQNICNRVYWVNGWSTWSVIPNIRFEQKGLVNSVSVNDLPNGIVSFTSTSVPTTDLPDIPYAGGCLLITCRKKETEFTNYDSQFIITANHICSRAYWQGAWQTRWGIRYLGKHTVTCGTNKDYTRLRDAIAKGVELGCEVIVYPGVYDLTQEFASELESHNASGILLANGVHVRFMAGSYVKCLVDVENEWAYSSFEPFRVNGTDFILEGLNIEAKNTRYCVHDEMYGQGTYHHKYINCQMSYKDEHELARYSQCIGGGLGEHTYIEIIGGIYSSHGDYAGSGTLDARQLPISYHNGDNVNADSKIFIKDVYLADKGYLRFGAWGPSEIVSKVFISGCSFGQSIVNGQEHSGGTSTLFDVTEWNNIVRQ